MGIEMEKISQRTISSFARQVARQFNPQKIILFGSYAYGKPTEDSDVDILVVMPFKGRNPDYGSQTRRVEETIGDGGFLLARDRRKRQSPL
jgi:predicted nucleotidyltransferase